jgi:5-hydroxyisourate hydrolase-like protein (transthyretin family)
LGIHPNVAVGFFHGWVVNGSSGIGIPGALVQAFSTGTNPCNNATCPPTTTDSAGYFQVTAPSGNDYLTIQAMGWVENETYAAGIAGISVDVGAIRLLGMARVYGRIMGPPTNSGPDCAFEPTIITSTSRDLAMEGSTGYSQILTNDFMVYVPPSLDKVTFTYPVPNEFFCAHFMSNFTYISAKPWQIIDLGNIYLVSMPFTGINAIDRENHAPIGADWGTAWIRTCAAPGSPYAGICGENNFGYTMGPPVEWNQTIAYVGDSGYLLNTTRLYQPLGGGAPTVQLVPMPQFTINVAISHTGTLPPGWNIGEWVGSVCSLDGFEEGGQHPSSCVSIGCLSPGIGPVTFQGFPLRNEIRIGPDTQGQCNYARVPQWPIPGPNYPSSVPYLPVWGNETVVNLSLSSIVNVGYLNLTPGSYIEGSSFVLHAGQVSVPAQFSVTAQSLDDPSMSQYSYSTDGLGGSFDAWACPGIPTPSDWCVPVPPGPVKVVAQLLEAVNQQNITLDTNFTWAQTPYTCCGPRSGAQTLAQSSLEHFQSINFTLPDDSLAGTVIDSRTGQAIIVGSVSICSEATAQCKTASVKQGQFHRSNISAGWYSLTATATGYRSNSVWEDVQGPTQAGTIPLTPLTTVFGYVVDSRGVGIPDAKVTYCSALVVKACLLSVGGTPLGPLSGLTTTDGYINGTLQPGAWIPGESYLISATALGYSTNWVWMNTSAGGYLQFPPIVLTPLVPPAATAGPATASLQGHAIWVTGRLVDASTQQGVQSTAIIACDTLGRDSRLCTPFLDGSNTYGSFNESLPPSYYNMYINVSGYQPLFLTLNATGPGPFNLGNLPLHSEPFIIGQAVIAPASWNLTTRWGFGPPADVEACTPSLALCGPAGVLNTGGEYNLSSPVEVGPIVILFNPLGNGGATYAGGFLNTSASIYVSGPGVHPVNGNASMGLFGVVSGRILESVVPSGQSRGVSIPAMGMSVEVEVLAGNLGSPALVMTVPTGGYYAGYLPAPCLHCTMIVKTVGSLVSTSASLTLNGTLAPGYNLVLPPLRVIHYGYIDVEIHDAMDGQPISNAQVEVTTVNATTLARYQSSDVTNEGGFVNVSAAPGTNTSVQVSTVSNYYVPITVVSGTVFSGSTTFPNGNNPSNVGVILLAHDAFVRSSGIDYRNPSGITVVDQTTQHPLLGATVSAVSSTPQGNGQTPGTATNSLGQFLVTAAPGVGDSLVVSLPGYVTNDSYIFTAMADQTVTVPSVNLTGSGMVAGTVLAIPGETPLAGAEVQACTSPLLPCSVSVTNASGEFWINVPPRLTRLYISAPGFQSNASVAVQACPDCFIQFAQPIHLLAFGGISGVLMGLPASFPIAGGNLSICPPGVQSPSLCRYQGGSTRTGNFLLSVAPGTYTLMGSAPYFDNAYLTLSIAPGRTTDVGMLFLASYGELTGTVRSATTGAPITGALLYACPSGTTTAPCTGSTTSGVQGQYALDGPPGNYTEFAAAPGYFSQSMPVTIQSGIISTASPLLLDPVGREVSFFVNGTVFAGAPPVPVGGGIVSATVNHTVVTSETSLSSGTFSLSLTIGAYELMASLPGYRTATLPVIVNRTLAGIVLVLTPMNYSVHGFVQDGFTHTSMASVQLVKNGSILAVTNSTGAYSLSLPNGTWTLDAVAVSSSQLYRTVQFVLAVDGTPLQQNISLFPFQGSLVVTVQNKNTGTPIPDAIIDMRGTAVDGYAITQTLTTDANGRFDLPVPYGSYQLNASASGYAGLGTAVVVSNATVSVTLLLVSHSSSSSSTSLPEMALLDYGLGIVTLVVAMSGIVLWRFRRKT